MPNIDEISVQSTPGDSPEIAMTTLERIERRDTRLGAWIRAHPFVIAFLLAVAIAGVYRIHYHYCITGDAFGSELLPIAILEGHGFDFGQFRTRGEPLHRSLRELRGRAVSQYPVVPGILNVPVFAIASLFDIDLVNNHFDLSGYTSVWISAASVGLMYLVLSRVCGNVWCAIAFTLIYAFATTVWSVTSRCLWQHGPSLLFLTGAMALLMSKSKRWLPYSGFLLGMAVWNRPPNIVFALPLAVFVFVHHRDRLMPFLILAAIPALLMAVYSQIYFGSVTSFGQGQPLEYLLRGDMARGFAGVLVSPSRGLLIFGPMFVFSFVYLFYSLFARNTEPLHRYLAIALLLNLCLFSKWFIWWGGHCFGYRMVTETVPILVLFGAVMWQTLLARRWFLKSVYVACVAVAVYLNFLGAYYYPAGFNDWMDSDHSTKTLVRLWSWRDGEIARSSTELVRDVRAWQRFTRSTDARYTMKTAEVALNDQIGRTEIMSDGSFAMLAIGGDPQVILPHFDSPPQGSCVVRVDIECPEHSDIQIFWTTAASPNYNREHSVSCPLAYGRNVVYLEIPEAFTGRLRIDPITVGGWLTIHTIEVRGVSSTPAKN